MRYGGRKFSRVCPDTPYPVIDLMPDQEDIDKANYVPWLLSRLLRTLPMRHMATTWFDEACHRYEVSNVFRNQLVGGWSGSSGVSPDDRLVEMIEFPESVYPFWFVAKLGNTQSLRAVQLSPCTLFREFARAAIAHHDVDRHDVNQTLYQFLVKISLWTLTRRVQNF